MSANAIETLRGCVESCAAESGAEHEGVGEDALAAVEALLEAARALLSDDDMPNHWDDCVCSYCVRYRATAAAVRRVESGQ